MKKASARSIIFKAAALLILIVIAVVMLVIGRGHTVYIDNKTLDSLKKGNNITMVTLEKLCRIVGCTPNEIVRFE